MASRFREDDCSAGGAACRRSDWSAEPIEMTSLTRREWLESVSRFSRFKSVRMSAACW